MRTGWRALAALALALFAMQALGQDRAVVRMEFSNPGQTPARWTLVVYSDGSGHFRTERGRAAAESQEFADSPKPEAPDQNRDIRLSARFAQRVFETARNHRWFNEECESHMKVAFQGWKKLSYAGPEGKGSCEFNYSRDKEIERLGESLEAVAATVLEGARLEKLLLHDRLGLDKEMEYLMSASGDGEVQQLCAIRAILERVAEDPAVMERVRKRAKALLAKPEE
jgi:hypothetical protein